MKVYGLDDYLRDDRRHRHDVEIWLRERGLYDQGVSKVEEIADGRVRVTLNFDSTGMVKVDDDGEILHRYAEVDGAGFPWPKGSRRAAR